MYCAYSGNIDDEIEWSLLKVNGSWQQICQSLRIFFWEAIAVSQSIKTYPSTSDKCLCLIYRLTTTPTNNSTFFNIFLKENWFKLA